jgi:predicted transcriptional regulator
MPAREMWLFDNETALAKVERGLNDAAAGHLVDKGSFSQYAGDDIEC